jgi:hypothetical protein
MRIGSRSSELERPRPEHLATVLCWYTKINDLGFMRGQMSSGDVECVTACDLSNDDKIDDEARA